MKWVWIRNPGTAACTAFLVDCVRRVRYPRPFSRLLSTKMTGMRNHYQFRLTGGDR